MQKGFLLWTVLFAGFGVAGASWADTFLQAGIVPNFFWNTKSELFSGLFTLSGLLLSVKTYIVVKLQEEIYSKKVYLEEYVMLSEENKTSDATHLEPLWRLSAALTAAVAISAIAAITQIVAAAVGGRWGAVLGFGSAGAAIGSLTFCWLQIRDNLTKYFNFLRQEAKKPTEAERERYRHSVKAPPSFQEAVDEIKGITAAPTSNEKPTPD